MIECFKIQLLQFDDAADVFELSSGRTIYTVPCLRPYLKSEPTIIEADPFLFVRKDRLYLFYESKPWLSPGVIKMVSTSDLKHWTKPIIVLKEPFHLSFPWVFEEDGHVYMIPETSGAKAIRLYKACNDSLIEFKMVKEIVKDIEPQDWKVSFVDTSIVKKEDAYYLFTTRLDNNGTNILELYVSDTLDGEYKKHPCSPIQPNNKLGRNAGSITAYEEKLLRFSQDCTKRYGDDVHVSEIVELTPEKYQEKLIRENLIPTETPFYREGGHQYNAVRYNGQWIVATDAKEYHKMTIHRLMNKVRRMLHF